MPVASDRFLRTVKTVMACLVFGCLMGCVQAGDTTVAPEQGQKTQSLHAMKGRIIVKFVEMDVDPSTPGFLAALSKQCGASIVYVRPMSGGAHVLVVEDLSNSEQLTDVISKLSKRSDVVYVEQDRIMRHQTPQ